MFAPVGLPPVCMKIVYVTTSAKSRRNLDLLLSFFCFLYPPPPEHIVVVQAGHVDLDGDALIAQELQVFLGCRLLGGSAAKRRQGDKIAQQQQKVKSMATNETNGQHNGSAHKSRRQLSGIHVYVHRCYTYGSLCRENCINFVFNSAIILLIVMHHHYRNSQSE